MYHKPIYVNDTIRVISDIRLVDKRFFIYEINFLIKTNKFINSEGKIIVKII